MKNKTFLKRFIPAFLVCMFTIVFATGPVFGQTVLCGDADGNGTVNILDALVIARYMAGLSVILNPGAVPNCNNQIDITVALVVAQYAAGLRSRLDCCTTQPTPTPPANLTLRCRIDFNPAIYPSSRHYPQFSLWVKDKVTGKIYSAYVTRFAGNLTESATNNRPYALPVWFGERKKEKTQVPYPALDTISQATPLVASTEITWPVPKELFNKELEVYLEGNISLDYNNSYTSANVEYNGQPSLIWLAGINTRNYPSSIEPSIIGHGALLGADSQIHTEELANITTARNLFLKLTFTIN